MNYTEWEKKVPEVIRTDVLWRMKVYRYSLFLSDICWEDVTKLGKDTRTKALSNQLYRSVGGGCKFGGRLFEAKRKRQGAIL